MSVVFKIRDREAIALRKQGVLTNLELKQLDS